MKSLRAELERAFALALSTTPSDQRWSDVLTLYASHDHALSELQHMPARPPRRRNASPPLHLDIRFCGSVDAIRALNEGRCALAGFHTQPFAASGSLSARTYRPLLKPGLHKIIGFARRSQGLMVAPGNPLRLRDIGDVARLQARFVNRALGTGTRLLLDELLAQALLLPDDIVGYRPRRRARTRRWPRPWPAARPTWAWAPSTPHARRAWALCRSPKSATCWCA